MSHMQLQISPKGTLYSATCEKCGASVYAHEWTHGDFNERRDAMSAGTFRCEECGGRVDSESFSETPRMYAGRYSAPGYLDCTPWEYDRNRRRLTRHLKDLYGIAQ